MCCDTLQNNPNGTDQVTPEKVVVYLSQINPRKYDHPTMIISIQAVFQHAENDKIIEMTGSKTKGMRGRMVNCWRLCQRTTGHYFRELEGLTLPPIGWVGKTIPLRNQPIRAKGLKHYWPNATTYDDIKKTNFNIWRHRIDICMADSLSAILNRGKRKGTDDDAICGPKCSAQLARLPRVGLWARTFAGLLIGRTGWFSNKCALIWKIKHTKYNRSYCQLAVSTHPIAATESFSLLLTPTTREEVMDMDKFAERMEKYPNGTTVPNLATQIHGLLPTPAAQNYKGASSKEALESRGRYHQKGPSLPDYFATSGKTSQLNPRFVAEMMGFPPNWTELPFQTGEENQ